jgi:hypothetical protein
MAKLTVKTWRGSDRLNFLVRFFHIHKFNNHHRDGDNIYKQCRCGAKRVEFLTGGGYSPLDTDWLKSD